MRTSFVLTVLANLMLIVAGGTCNTADAQANRTSLSQKSSPITDQLQLVIPSPSKVSCPSPEPPATPCCKNICLSGDNEWDQTPLPAGKRCAANGYCDGSSCACNIEQSGYIYPNYYIASVIYAPPGTGSSVDYGNGSTIGTTTSTTSSWKNSADVSVSNGADFLGIAAGDLTLSWGETWGGSTTTSHDLAITVTGDIILTEPTSDEMNHNYDQILIILGPRVLVTIYESQIQWAVDLSEGVPQVVRVGWLNGAIPMPSDISDTLASHGITNKDYNQILSADPYASNVTGTGAPDSARFAYVSVLPYEPQVGDKFIWKGTNNYTASTTKSTDHTYTVGASVSTKVIGQKLKASDSYTWTNSSSSKNSNGTTETDTLTLMMPSSSYTGPTDVYVYVDTIYKTLMCSFVSPSGQSTSRYRKQSKAKPRQ